VLVDAVLTEEHDLFALSPKTMGRLAERGLTILADVEHEGDEDE
jgi:hypothetical protein